MPDTRECPLCGETMQVKVRHTVVHVPGQRDAAPKKSLEWVCPECDYFEEVEDGDGKNA